MLKQLNDAKVLKRVLIGPEQALKLLESNYEGQRKVYGTTVSGYASDMASGNWNQDVVDPIRITRDGKLIDGQHRLWAVVESGVSVMFYFDTECNVDDYKFIDIGKKRTVEDVLGCTNGRVCASIARALFCAEHGVSPISSTLSCKKTNKAVVTNADAIAYYEANEELIQSLAREFNRLKDPLCMRVHVFALFMFLIGNRPGLTSKNKAETSASEFLKLCSEPNVVDAAYDTGLRLKTAGKMNKRDQFATLMQGYSAYVNGKRVRSFNKQDKYIELADELLSDIRSELNGGKNA